MSNVTATASSVSRSTCCTRRSGRPRGCAGPSDRHHASDLVLVHGASPHSGFTCSKGSRQLPQVWSEVHGVGPNLLTSRVSGTPHRGTRTVSRTSTRAVPEGGRRHPGAPRACAARQVLMRSVVQAGARTVRTRIRRTLARSAPSPYVGRDRSPGRASGVRRCDVDLDGRGTCFVHQSNVAQDPRVRRSSRPASPDRRRRPPAS